MVGSPRLMRTVLLSLATALLLTAPAAAARSHDHRPAPGPGPGRLRQGHLHADRAGERAHGARPRSGLLRRRRRLPPRRARDRPARARGAGLGGRPPLAGARGHEDVRRRPRRARVGEAGLRLLPGLAGRPERHDALPASGRRTARLRQALGPGGHPRRDPADRAPRAPPGQARHPRRPLARRVADDDLRDVGLRRPPGLRGRRRPGARRRRDAGHLRDPDAPADARRAGQAAERQPVRRCHRLRPALGGGGLRPGRRGGRAARAHRALPRAGLPPAPRRVQAARAGDEPRAARLRLRQGDLGLRPQPPGQPGPPGPQRRAARLGR